MAKRLFLAVLLLLAFCGAASAQATTLYGSAFAGAAGPATLYSIDPTTGVATAIGPIGFNRVGALATAPWGQLFGIGHDGTHSILIRIDPRSGAGTLIGSLGITAATQDMAFRQDGFLFAYAGGVIYTVKVATGAATAVGTTGGFPDGNALAFQGNTLLLGNTAGGANGSLQTVNQATGAVTVDVALAYGAGFNPAANPRTAGMKFDPLTGMLFAAVVQNGGGRFLAQINTTTGAVTDVGATVAGLDAIAFALPLSASIVPTLSPFALILMAAAMAALAHRFLRRRGSGRA